MNQLQLVSKISPEDQFPAKAVYLALCLIIFHILCILLYLILIFDHEDVGIHSIYMCL